MATRIIEKPFDGSTPPSDDEPKTALCGFDNHAARRSLTGAGFARTVDVGLGQGVPGYLDVLLHTFPANRTPEEVYREGPSSKRVAPLPSALQREVERQVREEGMTPGDAECGVLLINGASAAVPFVGAIAAALAVAELLRPLHNGPRSTTLSVNLGTPEVVRWSASSGEPVDDVIYLP
jgi:hypothetical protein